MESSGLRLTESKCFWAGGGGQCFGGFGFRLESQFADIGEGAIESDGGDFPFFSF